MRLTIDGQAVEVGAGATVLDAVNRLGLSLPQLCKDPDRPPLGACRTCLVQVEGQRGFPPAAPEARARRQGRAPTPARRRAPRAIGPRPPAPRAGAGRRPRRLRPAGGGVRPPRPRASLPRTAPPRSGRRLEVILCPGP